jgi:hypothetical protein
MACHEVAALRIGLMNILGLDDEAERQHELAELGAAANEAGPIKSLVESRDLERLRRMFEASLARLDEKVAKTAADDPKLPYYRSLVLMTKKVELDLRNHTVTLTRFWRDLEAMHDFVHEIYPAD